MTQKLSALNKKDTSWSGRFNEPVAELVKKYTASVGFDYRLAMYDIQGSIAHAQMLSEQGIISHEDCTAIEAGLLDIKEEINAGKFDWQLNLEDVHLNIEKRLTDKIGDAGKRLHTGRSRNDQVATDVRLWLRDVTLQVIEGLSRLQASLLDLAEAHFDTVMPGFTHLQVAQPITFGHHLMAYVEMLKRDVARFQDCYKRINRLPLGAAALAGTSYPINRERVAEKLGFDGVCENSLDAVSDRDFAIEFTFASSMVMMHLSRFSEELILWSSPRFAFIDIADRFCTGSSIMPQKKNPDVPELVRGKTGRVYGHLTALLTLMKAQPLAYNKDNQEDKEPLFDTADTLLVTLEIYADMLRLPVIENGVVIKAGFTVNKENMRQAASEGFATATDLADYLTKKGMPFRDAHEAVALAVRYAVDQRLELSNLPLATLQQFAPEIAEDVFSVLTLEGSLNSRNHIGGTAPFQVKAAIARARK
ncbi:MAG TPA: argininosuccinate lyase [Methylophilaceae bacterium]|mgnify:FL=1|nr:argininosuccinate lyase [Methylophilaceae bacterium]HQC28255.1 argininosuccinate lyase [Methylotenera sp.]